jgi:hypothetical protein
MSPTGVNVQVEDSLNFIERRPPLFNISDELAKPPAERNMLPLVDVYCPVCLIKDCSLPDCPISIAKWDGTLIGNAPESKADEASVETKTVTAITLPKNEQYQLTLFN